MARTIGWTERAWSDLEKAADFIAQDSPSYARTILTQAREAARSLERFAERGRVVPELGDPTIRELFVGSYRLIYRSLPGRIEVLAFVHGARDFGAVWRREDPERS